jgi:hypothetical protein
MHKLIHKIERDFTVTPNQIFRDDRLSFKAKGLWTQIIGLSDGWQFSIAGLAALGKDKESSVKSAIDELVELGYLKWEKNRGKDGLFTVVVTTQLPKISPHGKITSGEKTTRYNPDNKELKNKERNINKESTNKLTTPQALKVAVRLHACLIENFDFMGKKLSSKDHDRWAKDIEKIHRIDGYDYKMIEAVLEWSQQDEFWKQNIRSGATLRKQFTQLLVRIKSQSKTVAVIS